MTTQYLDAKADDFSAATRKLLQQQRKLYLEQKAVMDAMKAKVTASMAKDMPQPAGKVLSNHSYTRWGQLQVHISDVEPEKKNGKARMSLAEWQAMNA